MTGFQKFLIFLSVEVAVAAHGSTVQSQALDYQGLRHRLLVKATMDKNLICNKYPDYKVITSDTTPELENLECKSVVRLVKNSYYRISGFYQSPTYAASISNQQVTGMTQADENVYYLTLVLLDQKLNPTNVQISVAAKAPPKANVVEFEKVPDQLSMYSDLRIQSALKDDLILNFQSQRSTEGLFIPANSRAQVLGFSKVERIPYTLNYRYELKIQLLNCLKNCVRTISGDKSTPLRNWAHIVAKKNIRKVEFLGVQFYY